MCSPEFKQAMQIPRDAPSPQYPREFVDGYPIETPRQAGVSEYMAKNPHVSGMAMGGGENGSPPSDPRTIVVNHNNPMMYLPENRRGLQRIEAIRHKMGETGYSPQFQITPEIQAFREMAFKETDPYLRNDQAFKQSMVSRSMVGDLPFPMPTVQADGQRFNQRYFQDTRGGPLSQRQRP